jgi:hypothetical protein
MTGVSWQDTPPGVTAGGRHGPVSVPAVHDYGPYTLYDLDALPEDGKGYELADGWLTELSPRPWHDHAADRRTYYAGDLLLVAEVICPRSGSEQVDRVRKVREYARAGIPVYWIVDLEPEAKITILTLRGDEYALTAEIRAGHTLTASEPFAISFDPRTLTELE